MKIAISLTTYTPGASIICFSTAIAVARRVESLGLARGVIKKVIFDNDVRYSLVDNVAAVGMYGSGLIDLTAEMLNCGIIVSPDRLVGQTTSAVNFFLELKFEFRLYFG